MLLLKDLRNMLLVHVNNELTKDAGNPINIHTANNFPNTLSLLLTKAPTNLPSKLATLIVKYALTTNNTKCAPKYITARFVHPGIAARNNISPACLLILVFFFPTSFETSSPLVCLDLVLVAPEKAAVIKRIYDEFKKSDLLFLYTLNTANAKELSVAFLNDISNPVKFI